MNPMYLRLPIQFFGEEEAPGQGETGPLPQEPAAVDYDKLLESDKALQSFLDRRVDKATRSAVAKALEKEKLLRDETVTEAQKLSSMNEQERHAYQLRKLEQQVAAYEAEKNARALREEALALAAQEGVPAALVELIDFSSAKAEEVSGRIGQLKEAYATAVASGVAASLSGAGAPKGGSARQTALSPERIAAMSPREINENWEQVKAFMKMQKGN